MGAIMISRLLVAALACCLAACTTGATPKAEALAYLSADADPTIPVNRQIPIVVSALNPNSIAERELVDATIVALQAGGFRVSGSSFGYVLKVKKHYSENLETSYKPMTSYSYGTGVAGNKVVTASGRSTTMVPTSETARYTSILMQLWDVRDVTEALATGTAGSEQSSVVWTGGITGRTDVILNREQDAVRQLVARIGTKARAEADLRPNTSDHRPVPQAVAPAVAWSDYFSVHATRINRVKWTYNGEHSGYVKTRVIKTNRFEGFVELDGLQSDDPTLGALEAAVWSPLAYYTVRADGVFRADDLDLRTLDSGRVQKVFSLPLVVGERNVVRHEGLGAMFEYEVEGIEPVMILGTRYADCLVFSLKSTLNGNSDRTRYWYCPGIGRVQKASEDGTVTVLSEQ